MMPYSPIQQTAERFDNQYANGFSAKLGPLSIGNVVRARTSLHDYNEMNYSVCSIGPRPDTHLINADKTQGHALVVTTPAS